MHTPREPAPDDATVLLLASARGDVQAARKLLPLVYEELRQAAQHIMLGERAGHTLTPTALVHEAFLKIAGPREVEWADRKHFYFAAAQAMRRILIDHARVRARRGGERVSFTEIGDVAMLSVADVEQIEAVDAAIERLEKDDPEAADVVRLRLFAGLNVEQTAAALGMSPRSVARVWQYARAVLYRGLTERRLSDDSAGE